MPETIVQLVCQIADVQTSTSSCNEATRIARPRGA